MFIVIIRCGANELKFIEHSGFYFGFLFGLIQMVIWYFYDEIWVLPAAGFLVGYLTNYLALKLIFEPQEPINCLCWTLQGLFLKRQVEVSAEFAKMNCEKILNSQNLWDAILTGNRVENFRSLLSRHSQRFCDHLMGGIKPFVQVYLGTEGYLRMKSKVSELLLLELPKNVKYIHSYTNEALDLETTLREKMASLPPADFEGVLRPAFQEDELKLILVGAALGVMVGFFQVFFVFQK